MLYYDQEKLIPLCPKCSRELKELQVKSTSTRFYEYDYKTKEYKLAQRTEIEDDNVFHCPECGAGISTKEIFETLNQLK
jgi:DNA-directed RNA polymerase subunit RPC12/RpoP